MKMDKKNLQTIALILTVVIASVGLIYNLFVLGG